MTGLSLPAPDSLLFEVMMKAKRLATMKTNPERYINDALPNNRRRNTTNKRYFLPKRKK